MSQLDLLGATPWWVYLVFLSLLIIGMRSLYDRTMTLRGMLWVPIFFTLWSLWAFFTKYDLSCVVIAGFCLAIFCGVCIGMLLGKRTVSRRVDSMHISIAGSAMMLCLFLTMCAAQGYLSVTHALFPEVATATLFGRAELCINGLMPGIFWGRFIALWRKHF